MSTQKFYCWWVDRGCWEEPPPGFGVTDPPEWPPLALVDTIEPESPLDPIIEVYDLIDDEVLMFDLGALEITLPHSRIVKEGEDE